MALFVQEALVIADKHLGLDLFHSFKDNSYDNDDRCTTKRNICSKYTVKEERNNCHNNKANYTNKDYIIQDFGQIIRRRLTRSDTWDKTTLFLDIVCYLQWIKGNGSIEICKEDTK